MNGLVRRHRAALLESKQSLARRRRDGRVAEGARLERTLCGTRSNTTESMTYDDSGTHSITRREGSNGTFWSVPMYSRRVVCGALQDLTRIRFSTPRLTILSRHEDQPLRCCTS